MKATFYFAKEVRHIALKLISEHHRHLINVKIEYLFSSKEMKSKGKIVLGSMRKISSLNAFLAGEQAADGPGAFFCMVINAPAWDGLNEAQRVALVDHELCHAWVEEKEDGTPVYQILAHDVEDFSSVILRHGLWTEDLVQFNDVMVQAAQKSLYEEDEDEEEVADGPTPQTRAA